MPKYKIRFTRPGVVERTPKNPLKGGFEREEYPVGTELEVNDASLNFWLAKGCVENLGLIEVPFTPRAGGFTPFGVGSSEPGERKPITKTALRSVLEASIAALDGGHSEILVKGLAQIEVADLEDTLAELGDDSRMLITTAVSDAKNGAILGNSTELREALLDGADVLQPPSRRKRTAPPA